MGKQIEARISKEWEPFKSPRLYAYIQRIGSQLTAHLAEDTPFDYSFEVVIATHATEPISIPGGDIFVPAAFFLSAHNEDEFATMLAHSIGHIALQQVTRNIARQVRTGMQMGPTPKIPLIFFGAGGLHIEPEPRRSMEMMVPAGYRTMKRENELEADQFGVELASRSGYNASAFRAYLQRTQRAGLSALSALPSLELRLATIDVPVSPPSPIEEFLRCQQAVREALQHP